MRLVALDPADAAQVAAAAALHAALLPESPIPRLGDAFMRRFYYRKLAASGLIRCTLVEHDGGWGGLVVVTAQPDAFMSRGARRHPASLAWTLGVALLRRPSRLALLGRVLAEGRSRDSRPEGRSRESRPASEPVGEVLTIGVVDALRGRGAAAELLGRGIDELRAAGCTRVQTVTKRENRRAQAFYRSHGFEIDVPDYPGESCRLARGIG